MSTEAKRNSQISLDSDIYSPSEEKELAKIIQHCSKKKLPLEIIGTGSKKFVGYNLQTAKTINYLNFKGVIEYLPEELYIKVKPGTLVSDIENVLSKNNQELSFEPLDFGYIKDGKPNKGTIGGQVSCNFAGSRRFKVGSIRDQILGFRGVNGSGDIIKSGGTVVKNVTGYDLSKLITGSFGTLVALSEITLKVAPKKNSQSTKIIYSENLKDISKLFDKILSSSNEISGSVFIPEEPKNLKYDQLKEKVFKFNDLNYTGSYLAFRLEGDKKSIDERLKDLNDELELKKFKTSILDVYQSSLFWKKVNNLEIFTNTKNNLIRLVIPTAKNHELMSYLSKKFKYFVDWSGSLFWVEILDNENSKIKDLKKLVTSFGGYLTIIKKSENFDFEESLFTINELKLNISKKIKESFDKQAILNPGKMYREI